MLARAADHRTGGHMTGLHLAPRTTHALELVAEVGFAATVALVALITAATLVYAWFIA
jgi:hypothetical protein